MQPFSLIAAIIIAAASALQLPSTWGSSMVVEADVPNKLWGTDTPASRLTVTAFGQAYNASTDAGGAWSVLIAAQPKSTVPTTITVESSSTGSVTLSDVLVGYTVVCSGQSNVRNLQTGRARLPGALAKRAGWAGRAVVEGRGAHRGRKRARGGRACQMATWRCCGSCSRGALR